MKGSPSSSERALTSLRPDLPLRPAGPGPGPPSIDKFLTQLGNPGRFQIFVMLLLASNCIPVVVNHLLMAFYAVKTPHHCKVNWPEWIASLLYFLETQNFEFFTTKYALVYFWAATLTSAVLETDLHKYFTVGIQILNIHYPETYTC